MRLTIDSYAWIEVIRESPVAGRIEELFAVADSCFTPAIVLPEVARWCLRDGLDRDRTRAELEAIAEASLIVPISRELALDASTATDLLRDRARAQGLRPPGIGDGMILATARATGSGLLTGDRHFFGLPETLWLD